MGGPQKRHVVDLRSPLESSIRSAIANANRKKGWLGRFLENPVTLVFLGSVVAGVAVAFVSADLQRSHWERQQYYSESKAKQEQKYRLAEETEHLFSEIVAGADSLLSALADPNMDDEKISARVVAWRDSEVNLHARREALGVRIEIIFGDDIIDKNYANSKAMATQLRLSLEGTLARRRSAEADGLGDKVREAKDLIEIIQDSEGPLSEAVRLMIDDAQESSSP